MGGCYGAKRVLSSISSAFSPILSSVRLGFSLLSFQFVTELTEDPKVVSVISAVFAKRNDVIALERKIRSATVLTLSSGAIECGLALSVVGRISIFRAPRLRN